MANKKPREIDVNRDLNELLSEASAIAQEEQADTLTVEHVSRALIGRQMQNLGFDLDPAAEASEEVDEVTACCSNDPCTDQDVLDGTKDCVAEARPAETDKRELMNQLVESLVKRGLMNQLFESLVKLVEQSEKVETPDVTREEVLDQASRAYDRMIEEALDDGNRQLLRDSLFASGSLASIHLRYPLPDGEFDPTGQRSISYDRETGELYVNTRRGNLEVNIKTAENRRYFQWLIASLQHVDDTLDMLELGEQFSKSSFLQKVAEKFDQMYVEHGDAEDEDDRPQQPEPQIQPRASINRAEKSAIMTLLNVDTPRVVHHEILFTAARALERLGYVPRFERDMPQPETVRKAAEKYQAALVEAGYDVNSVEVSENDRPGPPSPPRRSEPVDVA